MGGKSYFKWTNLQIKLIPGTDDRCPLQIEERASVPVIFISSARGIESLRRLFSDNDYFGFEPQKVSIYTITLRIPLHYNLRCAG